MRRVVVVAPVLAAVFFFACVGSDPPPPTGTPGEDAGGTDGGGGVDSASPGADSASPGDSATDTGADAAGFDGGPPVWTSVGPGTVVTLASVTSAPCRIDLSYIQTAAAPPAYTVFLEKGDAQGATCTEPHGARVLGMTYAAPAGRLLQQSPYARVVVAYTLKATPSGSAPTGLTMKQVDWYSGNDMHLAQMKTKAIPGEPVTPSLGVEMLFFGDQTEQALGTVRLKGTGSFPGESGTGSYFFAVYPGFISGNAQLASAADSCTRAN